MIDFKITNFRVYPDRTRGVVAKYDVMFDFMVLNDFKIVTTMAEDYFANKPPRAGDRQAVSMDNDLFAAIAATAVAKYAAASGREARLPAQRQPADPATAEAA